MADISLGINTGLGLSLQVEERCVIKSLRQQLTGVPLSLWESWPGPGVASNFCDTKKDYFLQAEWSSGKPSCLHLMFSSCWSLDVEGWWGGAGGVPQGFVCWRIDPWCGDVRGNGTFKMWGLVEVCKT
jgi:hypothetical protein